MFTIKSAIRFAVEISFGKRATAISGIILKINDSK